MTDARLKAFEVAFSLILVLLVATGVSAFFDRELFAICASSSLVLGILFAIIF